MGTFYVNGDSQNVAATGSGNQITVGLDNITQYAIQAGGATNSLTQVAPSVTIGVPLVSQGAAATPVFGTASVAGGGTGAVSLTGVLTGNGTSAITANAVTQNAVLVGGASNGVASLSTMTNGELLIGSTGIAPVVASLTAGSGVDVAGGAGSITVSQSPERILNNYSVANASPYVVQADDYYITVDTSTIPITIQLPDAPTTYQVFIIKDSAGNAATQNVTVTTVSGIKLIDAAATFVMNTDWQSIHVVYDSFGYQVF